MTDLRGRIKEEEEDKSERQLAIIVRHKLLIVTDGGASDLLTVTLLKHFDKLKRYPSLLHDTQERTSTGGKRNKRNERKEGMGGREEGRTEEVERQEWIKTGKDALPDSIIQVEVNVLSDEIGCFICVLGSNRRSYIILVLVVRKLP